MSNSTPHAGNLSAQDFEVRVRRLIAKRTYKKGSITRRIKDLERVVSEGEHPDRVSYMLQCLVDTFVALQGVCEEISLMTQHREVQWHLANDEWIEAEKERVDLCALEVIAYIEARKDDQFSSASSFTETWVRAHAPSDVSQYAEVEEDLLLGATAASLSSSSSTNVVEDTIVEQLQLTSISQKDVATAVTPVMERYRRAGARPRDLSRPEYVHPPGVHRMLPSLPTREPSAFRDSMSYGATHPLDLGGPPIHELPMRPSSVVEATAPRGVPYASATLEIT